MSSHETFGASVQIKSFLYSIVNLISLYSQMMMWKRELE